jgi:hypothetical protein
MKRLAAALVGLLLLAAGLWWFVGRQHDAAHAGIAIGGGDGGGLPRATPGDEHLNAAAIDTVRADAAQQRLGFLLVARHGHLLLDYYANPEQTAALFDGGALSAALQAQLGDAAPQEPSALAAALSRQVWQPLNAQPARLVDGRVHARAADWLRVGLLLLGNGQFEGTEISTPERSADVHYDAAPPTGEPLANRDARALRAPDGTILWLVPALQLAVLQGGGADGAADTRFVNPLIRAIEDQTGQSAQRSQLNQLVPGH